jgi:hypothetical protein
MIIRKLLTFFLACMLIPAIIALFSLGSALEFLGTFWFLFFYGMPLLLLYGLPISCLSDKVTSEFSASARALVAFGFHMFFGIILVFLLHLFNIGFFKNEPWNDLSQLFLIFSTVGAFVVWGIDEILRKVADWEKIQSGM